MAVLHIDGREGYYLRFDLGGVTVDDDIPVLEGLLAEEVVEEVLDGLELLHGTLHRGLQDIPHPSGCLSDGFRHTLDVAELRRDMALLPVYLHYEDGLTEVGDLEVIAPDEVLGNADVLAICLKEPHGDRRLLEVDVLDKVGLLLSVVADNGLPLELGANTALKLATVILLSNLVNAGQAGLVRDERVVAVDSNRQP